MLRFVCEHCKESVRVEEAHAGRKGRCPHCGQIVLVPGQRLRSDEDDNVSALAAALVDEAPDDRDDDDGAAVPPPPTMAEPALDEFDLVTIEVGADFETDRYPAIDSEPPADPQHRLLPDMSPSGQVQLSSRNVTRQNVLLILVAIIVVGVIGAMIVWMHFC